VDVKKEKQRKRRVEEVEDVEEDKQVDGNEQRANSIEVVQTRTK